SRRRRSHSSASRCPPTCAGTGCSSPRDEPPGVGGDVMSLQVRTRAIAAGVAGGLLAGAAVGAAEAIGAWLHAHGTGELPGIGRALRGADARRRALTRPLVAAAVIAALALGWSALARMRPPPPSPPAPPRAAAPAGAPNVVLLMIDTLRADHLSCYGGIAVRTPHIDALATDGLRYANAFAQA